MHDMQDLQVAVNWLSVLHVVQVDSLHYLVGVSLGPDPDGLLTACTVERQHDPDLPQRCLRPL